MKKSKETFFVNVYRHGNGYMFGDNMINHKTLEEAVMASKDELDYVGAVRLEIEVTNTPIGKITELQSTMMRHLIPNRRHGKH